jgi:coproporphyrinogen III oxidase-like Fe-S oxidoreductase
MALKDEIERSVALRLVSAAMVVFTLFLGGGTPSHFSVANIVHLLLMNSESVQAGARCWVLF